MDGFCGEHLWLGFQRLELESVYERSTKLPQKLPNHEFVGHLHKNESEID